MTATGARASDLMGPPQSHFYDLLQTLKPDFAALLRAAPARPCGCNGVLRPTAVVIGQKRVGLEYACQNCGLTIQAADALKEPPAPHGIIAALMDPKNYRAVEMAYDHTVLGAYAALKASKGDALTPPPRPALVAAVLGIDEARVTASLERLRASGRIPEA